MGNIKMSTTDPFITSFDYNFAMGK
uniref:Uncharacterized protein n=1 Tax=Rhizophora mucronata TaxID=61149 RepID=A0A2P2IUF3_RHIMU